MRRRQGTMSLLLTGAAAGCAALGAAGVAATAQRVAGQRNPLSHPAGHSDSHTRDTGVRADANGTGTAGNGTTNEPCGDRCRYGLFRSDGMRLLVGILMWMLQLPNNAWFMA